MWYMSPAEICIYRRIAVAVGSTDESHHFGSMSLVNIAFAASLGWANPTLDTLEAQALIPMFGDEPVELRLSSITEDELLDRIREDERYGLMFEMAFQKMTTITVGNLARAIATFERTIVSHNSPYDRFQAGDKKAMSASAIREGWTCSSRRPSSAFTVMGDST